MLIVSPAKGYKSVAELVAAAKAKPGALNYASAGTGSATHMNSEKFRAAAGIVAVHVPMKGTPEAITETIAGRVDWFFAPLISAGPMIKDGKAVALAVGTSRRAANLPDVPTTLEAGVPNSDYTFWIGLFAPAKTPRDIVDKLQAEVVKVMASPEMKERLATLGAEAWTMGPTQFDDYVSWSSARTRRSSAMRGSAQLTAFAVLRPDLAAQHLDGHLPKPDQPVSVNVVE